MSPGYIAGTHKARLIVVMPDGVSLAFETREFARMAARDLRSGGFWRPKGGAK